MPALARLAVRPADRDAIRLDAVPLSEEGRNGGGAVAREIAEALGRYRGPLGEPLVEPVLPAFI